ncbi:hypothetical protein V6N11_000141 [Hibiscus sabdariffa]|uniref:Uncharacterized protein n=2 Tax=Hibiscus sabdariffa TaxID=183260 RepID=A0ABR2B4E3_9ROSI
MVECEERHVANGLALANTRHPILYEWVANPQMSDLFPSWIYDRFDQGENIGLGDVTEDDEQIVRKMIMVVFWCIQMKPTNSPSMSKVLEMLENEVEHLELPPKPFLFSLEISSEDHTEKNLMDESTMSMSISSVD